MELKITPSGQTIVKPTALGPGANTDTKLLIYGLFQKGRVLAQDGNPRGVLETRGDQPMRHWLWAFPSRTLVQSIRSVQLCAPRTPMRRRRGNNGANRPIAYDIAPSRGDCRRILPLRSTSENSHGLIAWDRLPKCPNERCRALSKLWMNPARWAALQARATVEISENLLHGCRQSMKWTTARVRPNRTDLHRVPEQSASWAALHENQVVALVFKHLWVPDMEVVSEQLDEFGVRERPRNPRLGNLEVPDYVQRRCAVEVPTREAGIEHQQLPSSR